MKDCCLKQAFLLEARVGSFVLSELLWVKGKFEGREEVLAGNEGCHERGLQFRRWKPTGNFTLAQGARRLYKKMCGLATVTQHICRKVEMIAHQLLRLLQDICKQKASSLYATCGLLLALQ